MPASETDLRWKHASRNPRLRLALIMGGIVLLVAGVFLWRYLASYESTDDAQIDGHLNPISARVSGHVIKLLVNDNQYVDAGTPLVEIDPKDYQVAVAEGQSRLPGCHGHGANRCRDQCADYLREHRTASCRRRRPMWRVRAPASPPRGSNWTRHAPKLEQATANNIKAQNDLGRYKQLVDKQEISQQQYDQAVAAARSNAAAVEAARASAAAAEQHDRAGPGQAGSRPKPLCAPPRPRRSRCRPSARAPRRRRPRPSKRKPNWIRPSSTCNTR